jgi:ribosomal protein L40E
MSSIKCLSCGLVNFVTDETCKKCGSDLKSQKRGKTQMSTSCRRCGSEHTQSFQMAYKTGTSHGVVAIVGSGGEGDLGLAGGISKTQSVLADNLKPPAPPDGALKSAALIFLLVVLFNMVTIGLTFLVSWFVALPVGAAVTIAVAVFGMSKAKNSKGEEQREFESAMKRWTRSWVCLKCGGTWLAHQ